MGHPSDNTILATFGKTAVGSWEQAPVRDKTRRGASTNWLQRDRNLGERVVFVGVICDTIVITGAMLLAFWMRFCTFVREYGVVADVGLRDYAGYIGIGAASMLLTLAYRQFYSKTVILRYRRMARQIFEAVGLWVLGFLSISLILKFQPPVSRLYVGMAGGTLLGGLLISRYFLNLVLHSPEVVASLRQRVLFVGWNEEAERLAEAFGTDVADAYELIGCITPTGRDLVREPADRRLMLGCQENIAEILERWGIDIVMLTDMSSAQTEIVALANRCEQMMVQFKVIPSYFQILVSGLHLETVSGIPILGVSRLPLDRSFNTIAKRVVDIIGACVGLLFLPPLFAVCGLLVYLESPGPILFRQQRRGRNGRAFWMYKIRSMQFGAEKVDHLSQSTVRQDPRLLKVGAFMRRWNLDEVPQFWNVLTGDMSLVGPRPERLYHSEKLSHEIPHYNARHNVKPGITGWAQVKGLRGDTDLCERVKCDLFYLENWSLLLDLQIMVMTFFNRDNAC